MAMMRERTTICAALALAALAVSGCQHSGQQAVAKAPAQTPAPAPAAVPAPTVSAALPEQPLPISPEIRWQEPLVSADQARIEALIAQMQSSFDKGQREYAAGDLDQARADFNRALDLIVASGFRADSDPRLQHLSDQISQALNQYEATAEQQDQQEEPAEAPSQPSAMDEIADITLPPGDPRLAAIAQRELATVPHDMPLSVNEAVLQYLSFFTTPKGRAIVEHGLEREGRYDAMIRRVLKQEGVPQDLIYLAQAESAFQPTARSRARAQGLWQFVAFTGEEYDLDRTYWVDERNDPERATHAAARYLRDLYDMFGDWYLAMAAYNAGAMDVVKAIQRTGYADFWQLRRMRALPQQTCNYVPIILALELVGKEPALYGINVDPQKPDQVDSVKPGHAIDLRLVADAAGVDLEDLRSLNPELLRMTTPNDPEFALKLPAGTADRFEKNVQLVPESKWTSWRLHEIEQGETLAEIARHYRVTLRAVEEANNLDADADPEAGSLLVLPLAPPRVRLVRYRVRRGDTLASIAERFDVTVPQLKRWNHLRTNRARRGARLRIYTGGEVAEADPPNTSRGEAARSAAMRRVSTAHANAESLRHRVKQGETLYSIAREYGTTVDALRERNRFLAERSLQAGDLLVIRR